MALLTGIKETYLFWKETYLFWKETYLWWRETYLWWRETYMTTSREWYEVKPHWCISVLSQVSLMHDWFHESWRMTLLTGIKETYLFWKEIYLWWRETYMTTSMEWYQVKSYWCMTGIMSHDVWHSWLVLKRPIYFEKRPIYDEERPTWQHQWSGIKSSLTDAWLVSWVMMYDTLDWYGVAAVSKIDKITGLFCRISSLL